MTFFHSHLYSSAVFLAHDAFIRTNHRATALMFVHLSVHPSVWDGRAL